MVMVQTIRLFNAVAHGIYTAASAARLGVPELPRDHSRLLPDTGAWRWQRLLGTLRKQSRAFGLVVLKFELERRQHDLLGVGILAVCALQHFSGPLHIPRKPLLLGTHEPKYDAMRAGVHSVG